MNLLEILGLHYLLTDKPFFSESDIKSIPGIAIAVIGFFGWFIIGTVDGRYQDISVAVWNLIPAIVLLIALFVRTVLSITKHDEKKKIIFNIVNLVITIVFASVFQLYHPYISLLSQHEYRLIWSFIAYTLWPNFIMLIAYNMLFDKENGIVGKIAMIPKGIGLFILVFLYVTFIGQTISTILYFTGGKDFYNNFAYYHNIAYREGRKEIKDQSVEDFLNEKYSVMPNKYDEYCQSNYSNLTNEEFEKKCSDYKIVTYVASLNGMTDKKYGFKINANHHIKDSNQEIIRVKDCEWNKYNYFILDLNTFKVTEITEEKYYEIRNQKSDNN